MTTNDIEKQLKHKAEQQISEQVRKVVEDLSNFSREHTGINRSGLHWYSKRAKPVSYTHLTLPTNREV